VIWGGNNENEGALTWYPESTANRDLYLADYVKLYVDTMATALRAVDTSRPFVDSSPSNGLISEKPFVKRWGQVQDPAWGDVHYYNYAADCEDPDTYPKARFVSEHGFQSFPSFASYKTVTAPEDQSRESWLMFMRQHHENGNEQVVDMMGRHFHVPPANTTAGAEAQAKLFDDFLYLTQVQQSRCYETAFGQWRRLKSTTAKTMGILYWQLNDVWQGPSWASIEYSGQWKVTHYAVARIFAPLLLSGVSTTEDVQIHVTSDLQIAASGTLTVEVFRWSDTYGKPVITQKKEVAAKPLSSTQVASFDWSMLTTASIAKNECFLRFSFDSGDTPSDKAVFFPTNFTEVRLLPAHIRVASAVWEASPNTAVLNLTTNATAPFVWLEVDVLGRFSDNGMVMVAGETRSVTFKGATGFDLAKLIGSLRIRSLSDTYSIHM